MLTFRIEFPANALDFVVSCLHDCARVYEISLFKRIGGTDGTAPTGPDYIVFHPGTGVFGALWLSSEHLSFRVEHPVHLSCDVRAKTVFFAFARALKEKILERLAVIAYLSPRPGVNALSSVSLKPEFPGSPRGLTFGEGSIWDEWSLARAGPEVWEGWLKSVQEFSCPSATRHLPDLFLELGFGSGDFLASEARSSPCALFIGVESSAESIQYAAKKIRDLGNVKLIHADAISFLRWQAPSRAFSGIFIHFPYPWDKPRHRHRRMIRRDTLSLFEDSLRANGFLRIVTDSENYAREIYRLLRRSLRWSSVSFRRSPPPSLRSRYLERWMKEGRTIYTVFAVRSRESKNLDRAPPARQHLPVPALLGTVARFPLASPVFSPLAIMSIQEGIRRLRVEGVYDAEDQNQRLLRLLAVLDDGIARRVYLRLRSKEEDYSLEVPEGARFLELPGLQPLISKLTTRLQEESLRAIAPQVFERLLGAYGPQNWWPYDPQYHRQERSDFRDEIAIGAILTQATTWRNVERALQRLKEVRALSLLGVVSLPRHVLLKCLEPARFPGIKAERLLSFVRAFNADFGGSWDLLKVRTTFDSRRDWLLRIPGIGEETADSVLVYALGDPVFVVDAYTRRLFQRMGYTPLRWFNRTVQDFIRDALGSSPDALGEFHALIVHHAKTVCLSRAPRCEICAVADLCAFGRSRLRVDKIKTGTNQNGKEATIG